MGLILVPRKESMHILWLPKYSTDQLLIEKLYESLFVYRSFKCDYAITSESRQNRILLTTNKCCSTYTCSSHWSPTSRSLACEVIDTSFIQPNTIFGRNIRICCLLCCTQKLIPFQCSICNLLVCECHVMKSAR